MADQAITETLDTETPQGAAVTTEPAAEALVEEQLLVEDVSIDGMCGVY